jgi:hypothetical protein
MTSDDIQIIEQKDRVVIQSYFKLKHNNNYYTFVDYIYEDSNEPVECGEYSSIFDNTGHLVEDEEMRDMFGEFADANRRAFQHQAALTCP